MLEFLKVSNLAVVESATAEFVSGLNVITGETGAGKSVLMGALELVTGARAEAEVVREGAKEAEVEARFGEREVRRTINAEGRSRCWIDGESVTVAELRDFCRGQVDVHGPRANQKLLEEDFQREALDATAGAKSGMTSVRFAYATKWLAYSAVRAKLEAFRKEAGEEELDLLRYQLSELDAAGLSAEDSDLEERHAAAAHAEEIVEHANAITETLGGERGVGELLANVRGEIAAVAKRLPSAGEWLGTVEDVAVKVDELSRAVAEVVSRSEIEPGEFEAMDARLGVIKKLYRKYRVATVEELVKLAAAKRERLEGLENREATLEKLEREAAAAEKDLRAAGRELTELRRKTAATLGRAVTRELKDLGFNEAKFSVAVEASEPAEHGCDRIVYMFEPNPGENARPLAAIASSGEIARVMLALKSVIAEHDATPLMVFDEIDANIGGEIGRVVGEKLRHLAEKRQVIAITHLPQSAVYGERHLTVVKRVAGGRTRTTVAAVEGEARIDEIARMLGGEKLTSVTRKHAEELLDYGR